MFEECNCCRLVTRATIEERILQQAKSKLVLEHLVVEGMTRKSQIKQQDLDDLIKYGAAELFADSSKPIALPGTMIQTFDVFPT